LNFIESARLAEEIKRDLTALAIDRQIEIVSPKAAEQLAQLLIISYLRDVIGAQDIANEFAACVGVAAKAKPQPERRRKRTARPRAGVA
jgi:hypothetical protein